MADHAAAQVLPNQRRVPPDLCACDLRPKQRTSWTMDNPGRRFWNCVNSLRLRGKKCGLFVWKDDELQDEYYKNLMFNLKQQQDPALREQAQVRQDIEAATAQQIHQLEVLLGESTERNNHLEVDILVEREDHLKEKVGLEKKVWMWKTFAMCLLIGAFGGFAASLKNWI